MNHCIRGVKKLYLIIPAEICFRASGNELQRLIRNPVKQLRWSSLRKELTAEAVNYFPK